MLMPPEGLASLDFHARIPKHGATVAVNSLTPVVPRWGVMLRGVALSSAIALAAPAALGQSATDEAAAAYEQGQRAFANGDFSAAAEFFETADRTQPAAQALIQAIRAHRGMRSPSHDARAATLALTLLRREAADPRITAYASRVVDDLSPQLARVTVQCNGCDLSLDAQTSSADVFAEPGPHTLTAAWGLRVTHRPLQLLAGSNNPIELTMPGEAPPPATEPARISTPEEIHAQTGVTPIDTERPPALRGALPTIEQAPRRVEAPVRPPTPDGLSPGVFVTGMVITAGLAGALVWSGLDTLEGNDAYVQNPTQTALDDGRVRELRTNVLLGATAAAGVTTLVIGAFFTRWRSAPVYAGASPAGMLVGGRF